MLPDVQVDGSSLPFWPTSPLRLALLSLLILIPPPEDPHPICEASIFLRRSYAELYARSALESVENPTDCVGSCSNNNDHNHPQPSHSSLGNAAVHPNVPLQLQPVLALALLSMYECCQRDNRPKMRIRANHAFTMAMHLSLHTQDADTPEYLETHRRVWWMTVFLIYQSSIMNGLLSFSLA